jgi:anti-sigma regulatory factor (Ser/Thr protein kinase)
MEGSQKGFRIVVEDWGPGIKNIAEAMKDGRSQGRVLPAQGGLPGESSLGSGLGTVRRFMSRVRIRNKPAGGLKVVACKLRAEDR